VRIGVAPAPFCLEQLERDPLLHMVRNAIDHGLENGEKASQRENLRPARSRCAPSIKAAKS
jgi:hypothetical protein